ncbi:hypothetical protein OPV22_029641 [Ensete ventricosum]|uniref:Myb-like domain-containing protein n=1 Tax=Ensete ventricosum TaxID=4639 RepID=A0AAV8Q7I3_ENSVE|nr:hypothetical protein OPV22_029641 [Ensete ventricosum]
MGKRSCRLQQKTIDHESEEVSSKEWEFILMSEQEEDLIHRMYRIVGDRANPREEAGGDREVLDNEALRELSGEACSFPKSMGKRSCRLQQETIHRELEDVSSKEWEFIDMSEQEEDLIHRMYRLVGDRWGLIADRVPGRKAEEIERFWIMSHGESFAEKRLKREAGRGGRATS